MCAYLDPALVEGMSPLLRARMQGRACVAFTGVDGALLDELDAVTRTARAVVRARA